MSNRRKSTGKRMSGSSRTPLPYPSPQGVNQVLRVKKRRHRKRKVVVAVFGVIALLVVAAFALAASYVHGLNDEMSLGADESQVRAALSDVSVNDPFYVLVLGSDTRSEENLDGADATTGRSDVMMLVRVDTARNKLTVVSIPRDTPFVEADGSIVKINHELTHGPAASIEAVESLTGVKVSHYIEVSFSQFAHLVDYLGGVDVDVPVEITNYDVLGDGEITLEPGRQTLDGTHALVFARSRFDYEDSGDMHRQSAVRQIVSSSIDKVRVLPVGQLPEAVQEVASCVSTDLNMQEFARLAMELRDGDVAVYSATGPYAGDFIDELDGEWMCYEDPEGWERLMEVVDSGEDPESITYEQDMVSVPEANGSSQGS